LQLNIGVSQTTECLVYLDPPRNARHAPYRLRFAARDAQSRLVGFRRTCVIHKDGATAALKRFVVDDSTFGDAVLLGIASGDSAWLEVARLLKPTADAGASEFLGIAVADALPAAPERVLTLVGPDYPAERVCGMPFIEQPDSEAVHYYRRARAGVEQVRRPDLAAQRAACLDVLKRARPSGVAPAG
jgi:hypothetical protein